jgi:hypothetical protein
MNNPLEFQMPRRTDGLDELLGKGANDEKVPTLDYAQGVTSRWGRSPLVAFLLCLPGSLCWIIYFDPALGPSTFTPVGVLWVSAVITAVASIFFYWKKRKPWFVLGCLCINMGGLAFTLWFWSKVFLS